MNRPISCVAIFAALAGAPSVASASAISDLTAGTNIFLSYLSVTIEDEDGEYNALGYLLPKDAGTLDLDLSGTDVGLNTSQTIHLNASINGDIVTWSFNKTFNPPLDIDGTNELVHAYGSVKGKVELISGFQTPYCEYVGCTKNVRVVLASGSHVTIEGNGFLGIDFTREVYLQEMKLTGGIVQPELMNFVVLETKGPTCSKPDQATVVQGISYITSMAPTGGTRIDFLSSANEVDVPSNQKVLNGNTSTSFITYVPANFTGYVLLTAASSGAEMTQVAEILGEGNCDGDGNDPFDFTEWVPPLLAGCIQCLTFVENNVDDVSIGLINRMPVAFIEGTAFDLTQRFSARSVSIADLSDGGFMTGTIVPATGPAYAFKTSVQGVSLQLHDLGAFTPTAINEVGVVAGHRLNAASGLTEAVIHNGRLSAVSIAGARWSRTVAVSGKTLVGTFDRGSGTQGFSYDGRNVTVLPNAAIPVAVASSGKIAANTVNSSSGNFEAAIIDGAQMMRLPPPPGYIATQAKSINRNGWVVGTMTSRTGTEGFIYTPREGLRSLNSLAPSGSEFHVLDALQITARNKVVVRARLDGREDLYLIQL